MIDLINSFRDAVIAEQAAKALRVKLAVEIASKLAHPDEGSKTHTVEGFKVTISTRINRKVDWDALDVVVSAHDLHAPVRTKRELDLTGLKWCRDNEPDYYNELAKTITATPGQPTVTVKDAKK
jgi:hypothetical protein